MTLVGAGALGAHFVRAHASVRPIKTSLHLQPHPGEVGSAGGGTGAETASMPAAVTDLEAAVRQSDIVTCVTTSTAPIVKGAWLKPGAHVDLAGAFKPSMRETDGEVVARVLGLCRHPRRRAGRSRRPAAGPRRGQVRFRQHQGRSVRSVPGQGCRAAASADEITLFKSAGTAIEDLATAIMVYQKAGMTPFPSPLWGAEDPRGTDPQDETDMPANPSASPSTRPTLTAPLPLREPEAACRLHEGRHGVLLCPWRCGLREGGGAGLPIFLDLKLHDIPNTVASAMKSLMRLDPKPAIVNVHATGGLDMMKAAADAVAGQSKLIAVTILTSLSDDDIWAAGFETAKDTQGPCPRAGRTGAARRPGWRGLQPA